MNHGACKRDSELLEKVLIRLRYGHPGTEARQDSIVSFDHPFEFGSIEQISFLDGDAVAKRFKSLRRAHQRGHRMAAFYRLPNNFQSDAPRGTEYNQFHAALCSRPPSGLGFSIDVVSHIGYR